MIPRWSDASHYEFIDITIDGALKYGARYVMMNVFVFSGPTFKEHKTVYAGWMTRQKPGSNEIYDPKTVENKVDLVSATKNAVPVIFDLKERKAIWADLTTTQSTHYFGNNVESNMASIEETLEAITGLDNKVTLAELFALHVQARGSFVEEKSKAKTIFSMKEGITPSSIALINSEYIA